MQFQIVVLVHLVVAQFVAMVPELLSNGDGILFSLTRVDESGAGCFDESAGLFEIEAGLTGQ